MTETTRALESLEGIPEDKRLGALAFVQIANVHERPEIPDAKATLPYHARVTREDLEGWLFELGIGDEHLPSELRKTMAFKRVTNGRSGLRYTLPSGHDAECRFITVSAKGDRDRSEVHLMRTVTDRGAREASAETCIAQLLLYKAGRDTKHRKSGGASMRTSVMTDKLSDFEVPIVTSFVKEAVLRFQARGKYYDADALRKMVRNQINALNAIHIGNGSYFVHQSRIRKLTAIEELVSRFPDGSHIHIVPMPDNPYQRERLSAAYEEQVESEMDSLLASIARAADGGTVTSTAYGKLHEEFMVAMQSAEEHGRLLDRQQERSGEALSLAMKAIQELSSLVEA